MVGEEERVNLAKIHCIASWGWWHLNVSLVLGRQKQVLAVNLRSAWST